MHAEWNASDTDLGYGLPVGSRFVGTPTVGFGTSEYGRDYRLGYSLGVLQDGATRFEVGVDAQRRESPFYGRYRSRRPRAGDGRLVGSPAGGCGSPKRSATSSDQQRENLAASLWIE